MLVWSIMTSNHALKLSSATTGEWISSCILWPTDRRSPDLCLRPLVQGEKSLILNLLASYLICYVHMLFTINTPSIPGRRRIIRNAHRLVLRLYCLPKCPMCLPSNSPFFPLPFPSPAALRDLQVSGCIVCISLLDGEHGEPLRPADAPRRRLRLPHVPGFRACGPWLRRRCAALPKLTLSASFSLPPPYGDSVSFRDSRLIFRLITPAPPTFFIP